MKISEIVNNDFNITLYPNPVNSKSVIEINLGNNSEAQLVLHDVLDREVALPFDTTITESQTIPFSGVDHLGVPFLKGIYFLLVRTGTKKQTIKVSI